MGVPAGTGLVPATEATAGEEEPQQGWRCPRWGQTLGEWVSPRQLVSVSTLVNPESVVSVCLCLCVCVSVCPCPCPCVQLNFHCQYLALHWSPQLRCHCWLPDLTEVLLLSVWGLICNIQSQTIWFWQTVCLNFSPTCSSSLSLISSSNEPCFIAVGFAFPVRFMH